MPFWVSGEGKARPSDPLTSHIAALLVDTKKGQRRVIALLSKHGPMTQEEAGKHIGRPSDHLGPRFCTLERRRIIRKRRDPITRNIMTKAGDSGRPRNIYEIQPDTRLWLDHEPDAYTSRELRFRDKILEEAIQVIKEFEDVDEIVTAIREIK